MKLLAGTISLSVSFMLFIYLYGLQATISSKYSPALYFYPILLLILSMACFGRILYRYDQSLKKEMNEQRNSGQ